METEARCVHSDSQKVWKSCLVERVTDCADG